MNLLLLGGTSDARRMASTLHKKGIRLIYSVAGLVRTPDLPCTIVSGGFSQFGGLAAYIKLHKISAILDVTHPYAQQMSDTAVEVARLLDIPCWRFHREPWVAQKGDQWLLFDQWHDLMPALRDKKVVFLSMGQVTLKHLQQLSTNTQGKTIILRTAAEPSFCLPAGIIWIKAIGPFDVAAERQLFEQYGVDSIVSKNSGGEAIIAKIHAARELNIPVYMMNRPIKKTVDKQFLAAPECGEFVAQQSAEHSFMRDL